MKKETFVLVSKASGKHGRDVLQSFASKPLWKDYEEMRRQNDPIPTWYDKQTMEYALTKYASHDKFEVLTSIEINKEFDEYKTTFPNWQ